MIKSVLVAALMTSSSVAMASNARVTALQGSVTSATDIQDTITEPGKMWDLGDAFALELGEKASANTATQNAEGIFIRSMGDSKLGIYFGKQSSSIAEFVTTTGFAATQANAKYLDNPWQLNYAQKGANFNWGAGLYYANSQDKKGTDQFKKNAMGVSLSAVAPLWTAYANIGLGGKLEAIGADTAGANQENITMKSNIKLGGQYNLDDMAVYGYYHMVGGKRQTAAGADAADVDKTDLKVGVESKIKTDNAHFFYGAAVNMVNTKEKNADYKKDLTLLPLTLGIEADAASWLVLRGAYTQNLSFIDTVKESTGATTSDEGAGKSDATLTAGAGFKFNKTHIDFALSAQSNAKLSTTDFGTEAGLTYWF